MRTAKTLTALGLLCLFALPRIGSAENVNPPPTGPQPAHNRDQWQAGDVRYKQTEWRGMGGVPLRHTSATYTEDGTTSFKREAGSQSGGWRTVWKRDRPRLPKAVDKALQEVSGSHGERTVALASGRELKRVFHGLLGGGEAPVPELQYLRGADDLGKLAGKSKQSANMIRHQLRRLTGMTDLKVTIRRGSFHSADLVLGVGDPFPIGVDEFRVTFSGKDPKTGVSRELIFIAERGDSWKWHQNRRAAAITHLPNGDRDVRSFLFGLNSLSSERIMERERPPALVRKTTANKSSTYAIGTEPESEYWTTDPKRIKGRFDGTPQTVIYEKSWDSSDPSRTRYVRLHRGWRGRDLVSYPVKETSPPNAKPAKPGKPRLTAPRWWQRARRRVLQALKR